MKGFEKKEKTDQKVMEPNAKKKAPKTSTTKGKDTKEKKEKKPSALGSTVKKFVSSFKSKVCLLVVLCSIATAAVTLIVMINNTKNMVIDSSLGQMLNIATSYGNIVDSKEQGELLTNEEYAAILSDLKIDSIESSYCFLLNKSGVITYHADESKIGKPAGIPFITELIGNVAKGQIPENLSASFEQDGKIVYCSYYLTECYSALIVCADADELMKPLISFIMQSLLVVIVVLVAAILLSNFIVGRITKPLEQVTRIINDASQLKFSLPANIDTLCAKEDESGQICRAVKDMCNNLRDVVQSIENSSNSIESNMEQLEVSSNQVHLYCADNSATSEQLAASMQETSAMAETINNHMIHMSEQSNDINNEASNGTQLSEEVAQRAKALQKTTITAIDSTKKIYQKVKGKTEEALAGLESVSKINELTDAIKEISDQTSLLSLNASIEAARAGEAGRGFAVVASEISKLAHRSLNSVNDINRIINEVNVAVSNMSETSEETLTFLEKNVLNDYDNFNHVGEQYLQDADVFKNSMLNISREINQLDASIQQIATGINDIQTTINEASIGVTDIAEKTSETFSKANDNYQLSSDTKANVSTLKEIVDKFEI